MNNTRKEEDFFLVNVFILYCFLQHFQGYAIELTLSI